MLTPVLALSLYIYVALSRVLALPPIVGRPSCACPRSDADGSPADGASFLARIPFVPFVPSGELRWNVRRAENDLSRASPPPPPPVPYSRLLDPTGSSARILRDKPLISEESSTCALDETYAVPIRPPPPHDTRQALNASPGPRLRAALETLPPSIVALAPGAVVQRCCDTVNSQGVVALVNKPQIPLPSELRTVLICDGVQDPGVCVVRGVSSPRNGQFRSPMEFYLGSGSIDLMRDGCPRITRESFLGSPLGHGT